MLLSLLLILVVSILYLCLMRSLDKQTSSFGLTAALAWGGVSFALALMVQTGLADGQFLNMTQVQLVSAPLLEELLKALPLLVLISRSRHSRHGAIYGFAMGLGFALFESTLYISANPDFALGTALARVISIHLIHGFTTALIGLIVSRRPAPRRLASVLLIAVLVHAAFNGLVLALAGNLLLIAAAYAGIGSAVVLSLLMSRRPALVPANAN